MDTTTLARELHTKDKGVGFWRPERCQQIALVLQRGGALGAYQAGVYQALHEAGIEPDWLAGVSIGAERADHRRQSARGADRQTPGVLE